MKRIEPECFIEVFSNGITTNLEDFKRNPHCNYDMCNIIPIKGLSKSLATTQNYQEIYTVALFLIQPQTTSLEERMEARIAENVIKGINITNQLK